MAAAMRTISSATASPAKRKRSRAIPTDNDAISDVESYDLEFPSPRTKKARFLEDVLEDGASNLDACSYTSLGDTVAETGTAFTDISSVRSQTKSRPKKYFCTILGCGKAFDRPIRLQTHINSHTGERPHACTEEGCEKRFFKAEHLKQHIHDKHTDYQGFVCAYPVRDDNGGKIGACEKTFPTRSKWKRHVALHEQKEETTCSWEGCGKVFRKQETLQRHVKKDHLNELPYQCLRATADGGTCGSSFATPGQLKGHEAQAHEEPKYWCEICNHAAMDDGMDASDVDPFRLHHASKLQDLADADDDGIIRALNLQDAAIPAPHWGAGPTSFASYAEFQHHMKHVHPPTCTACGKTCQSNRDLKAHLDIEHADSPNSDEPDHSAESRASKEMKRFVCPFDDCSRARLERGFTRKGNLDVHVQTVHGKAKAFICGQFDVGTTSKVAGWNGQGCGLALGTKQSLIAHVRTQHLGIPAAIGIRTGLREEDRVRTVRGGRRKLKEEEVGDAMDVDVTAVPTVTKAAVSLLTGAGYEEQRPFACLLLRSHGCQLRFVKEYDLAYHMEMTHGWNVDDINDALRSADSSSLVTACNPTTAYNSELELQQRLERELDTFHGVHQAAAIDPQLQVMGIQDG